MRIITCRTHGGKFGVNMSRGRSPVSCGGPYNVCDKYIPTSESTGPGPGDGLDDMTVTELRRLAKSEGYSSITRLTTKASLIPAIRTQRQKDAALPPVSERGPELVTVAAGTQVDNSSVALAKAAKARLMPLGWVCKGRGWTERTAQGPDEVVTQHAELLATRSEEMLLIHWADGKLVSQSYSLWSTEKPEVNGKPTGKLAFDPGELTDQELIRRLAGMPVTWWNSLGHNEMKAVISGTKIQVEHAFDGKGNELPGDRMIKFNDQADGGFRAFRLAALLSVG